MWCRQVVQCSRRVVGRRLLSCTPSAGSTQQCGSQWLSREQTKGMFAKSYSQSPAARVGANETPKRCRRGAKSDE